MTAPCFLTPPPPQQALDTQPVKTKQISFSERRCSSKISFLAFSILGFAFLILGFLESIVQFFPVPYLPIGLFAFGCVLIFVAFCFAMCAIDKGVELRSQLLLAIRQENKRLLKDAQTSFKTILEQENQKLWEGRTPLQTTENAVRQFFISLKNESYDGK